MRVVIAGSSFSTHYAVDFYGTNGVATFGNPPELGLATFTIECWFQRTGASVNTSTGTGGWTAITPLVTKGRGEKARRIKKHVARPAE